MPALGLAAHPFSIASVSPGWVAGGARRVLLGLTRQGVATLLCSPEESSAGGWGDLTLCIRDMGPGTWTRALLKRLAKPAAASAAAADAALTPTSDAVSALSVSAQASRCLALSPTSCAPSPQPFAWPWVMVSGPVGRPSLQLGRYSHVVLVAGGIGITAVAPVFVAAARSLPLEQTRGGPLDRVLGAVGLTAPPQEPGGVASSQRGRTVSLMWTVSGPLRDEATRVLVTCLLFSQVREPALLDTFRPALSGAIDASSAGSGGVAASADVFHGGGGRRRAPAVRVISADAPAPASAAAGPDAESLCGGAGLRLHEGGARPSVAAYLRAAARDAVACEAAAFGSGGPPVSIAVVVCGPPGMVDDVYAFTETQASGVSGGARVIFDVHHETFNL